jgi:galactan endo-1,6-beta-galactosidase
MQGFWIDGKSADPDSSSWDWNADANQRAMLLKAKSRGADHFELFSNSPMWWMCRNRNPSGADRASDDNLPPWNFRLHAVYLATIARYAKERWGILFDSAEPFNEPMTNYWKSTGTQEGCHFDVASQARVIGYLRSELNQRGLRSTAVAASDETSYDQATRTWNGFSAATKSQVGKVNVHGYQYGGGRRDLLRAAVAGKKLWNTEYGEADGTGMSLANNLNLDFRWLHPTAWCYWQPLDSGGWGLIQSNPGDRWIGPANPKYFVLAQYARHIRPGMQILDVADANTVAAYDSAARKLVLVTLNRKTAQRIGYDLSKFARTDGPISRWETNAAGSERYQLHNDAKLSGKKFEAWFPPDTVQTFEIRNVVLNGK